jgi:hypothetical protein
MPLEELLYILQGVVLAPVDFGIIHGFRNHRTCVWGKGPKTSCNVPRRESCRSAQTRVGSRTPDPRAPGLDEALIIVKESEADQDGARVLASGSSKASLEDRCGLGDRGGAALRISR